MLSPFASTVFLPPVQMFVLACLATHRPHSCQNKIFSGVLCVALGTLFLSICGIFIWALRNSLGYLFVDDKDVVAMVAVIAPIAAVYQFPDGILGTTNGVLRWPSTPLRSALDTPCPLLPCVNSLMASWALVILSSTIGLSTPCPLLLCTSLLMASWAALMVAL